LRLAASLAAVAAVASLALMFAPREWWLPVTWLGGSPAYMVLAPLLFHLLGGRRGSALVASLALAAGAAAGVKYWLQLPRPPEELWLAEAEGPGFPSAHAAVSAAFWLSLALAAPSPATLVLAASIPALVAGSRVALGVHYPWDAAGGLLLGAAMGLAASLASARLKPHEALALAGLAGLALQAPFAAPEPEAPLVALGAAAAAALLGGRLHSRPPREAALGSVAALTLGAAAAAAPGGAAHALMALAGAAAVAAPPLAEKLWSHVRWGLHR